MSAFVFNTDSIAEVFRVPNEFQEYIKNMRKALKDQIGPPTIYKVCLKEEQINVEGCKCFSLGEDSIKPNRTILVLGATGAGKTTLINGMINYILGVKWEDSFRLKLVDEGQTSQAESQTSEVTVYKIYHKEGFQIDCSLTIVDTPGFGDTRGIDRDRLISKQLNNLFTDPHGVSDIDAVCFVVQAFLARLTTAQSYVFDSVLSIFGKDIAENISILMTFADGQTPLALEAIKASGIPYPKTDKGQPLHFKFNNSALFANNEGACGGDDDDDDDDDGATFDELFWNMGNKSMSRFFDWFKIINQKSLSLTREVLKERHILELTVENLRLRVLRGLAKMDEIKQTHQIIEGHHAEIEANKDFEFEVRIKQPVQVERQDGFNTNCQQCNTTCHHPCTISNDVHKWQCKAMGLQKVGKGINCKQCPGKCHWSVHFNQKYNWKYIDVTEKRKIKALFDKYEIANKAKVNVQELISKLTAEYEVLMDEEVKLVAKSAKCLNRLKQIALKPNSLSTSEYIDLLIAGEKSECKAGFIDRISCLLEMKKKEETLAKVERRETLLCPLSTELGACSVQGT